jgi:hypothetical protein
MKTKKISCYFALLVLMVYAFSFSGCSRLSGPSDAEVIKAVHESEFFKDLTLQSPPVVLERGGRNKDGSWPVKVKVVFTYEIKDKQTSAPMQKTLIFNLYKQKDNAGHDVWRAALGH